MIEFSPLVQTFNQQPNTIELPHGYLGACWEPPQELDTQHKQAIYQALVKVSTVAFGADMTPYWRDRARDGYLDKITRFYFIRNSNDQIVGWTGFHRMNVDGTTCLYLDSTGMLPQLQKQGVMTTLYGQFLLSEFVRNRLRTLYLGMRTENPVVYQAFYKAVGADSIYPSLSVATPPLVQNVGRHLSRWLNQAEKFEPEVLRLRGAYDNLDALYGELPTCDDEDINKYFRKHLRPEDAFIVLAKMDSHTAFRVLRKALSRGLRKLRRGERKQHIVS